MYQVTQSSRKLLSGILCVLIVLASILAMSPKVHAGAEEGYSDMFRIYTLKGINRDINYTAVALLYGSSSASPQENYAVVIKENESSGIILIDFVSEEQLNDIIKNCISSSQVEVSNFNEAMLELGAPEEYLFLSEKPKYVNEIQTAIAQGKAACIIKEELVVTPDALKYAAAKGGNQFGLHFDTIYNNSVNVRLSVNAASCTKGFSTAAGVITNKEHVIYRTFEKFYSNKFVAIGFLQEGSFGTTVNVAAKADLTGMNKNNLYFYYYNSVTNKTTPMENTEYSVDDKGYLRFSTTYGGAVIVSDGPLSK